VMAANPQVFSAGWRRIVSRKNKEMISEKGRNVRLQFPGQFSAEGEQGRRVIFARSRGDSDETESMNSEG